jgi:hypothetical protein
LLLFADPSKDHTGQVTQGEVDFKTSQQLEAMTREQNIEELVNTMELNLF